MHILHSALTQSGPKAKVVKRTNGGRTHSEREREKGKSTGRSSVGGIYTLLASVRSAGHSWRYISVEIGEKERRHICVIFVAGTEMEFDNFTVSPFATLGNHTRKNITSDDIYFHKVKVY